ncbi:MAG: hypothetical protein H7301_02475 [Cryobacterium sp.]|nr:hypothetical protein [Oligoflexia bacterium]
MKIFKLFTMLLLSSFSLSAMADFSELSRLVQEVKATNAPSALSAFHTQLRDDTEYMDGIMSDVLDQIFEEQKSGFIQSSETKRSELLALNEPAEGLLAIIDEAIQAEILPSENRTEVIQAQEKKRNQQAMLVEGKSLSDNTPFNKTLRKTAEIRARLSLYY